MQHEKILKESLQGRERQRTYLPNLCNTSKHRCPTRYPTRKPPTAARWGRWGSLGNALEESGMLNAGCLPTRGDQFCTHGGGSEEMANIKRQRHRCNCNVCNSTSISLLKSPEKPLYTCFMVPRSAEVLFTERNVSQPLLFILPFWSRLIIFVGLQTAKIHPMWPSSLIHQHDRCTSRQ